LGLTLYPLLGGWLIFALDAIKWFAGACGSCGLSPSWIL
jgi:hypothetical protein